MNGQRFFSHGKPSSCGVFIAFFRSKSVTIIKKISDNNCRILVLHVKMDDEIYMLVNLCNSSSKTEQLKTDTLHKKLSFPLRISSVNVTKSAGNYGFGHIY